MYAAILVAAVAAFAVGAIWYAPPLFGRPFQRLLGPVSGLKKPGFAASLLAGFALELVRAYVMLMLVAATGAFSLGAGAETGFWAWLLFAAGVAINNLYERRSWKLFAINAGYHLLAFLVMGAILATW